MKADTIVDPRAVVVHFKGTSLTYGTVVRPVLNHEAQGFPILKTDLSGLIARHFSQYLTAFWTLLCLTRQSSCSAKVESKAFHSSSDWADRSLSTWNRLDLLRTLNQDMKKIMYWSIPMFHLIRAEMPWERCEAWRCEYYHGVGPDEQGGQAVEYDSTDHLEMVRCERWWWEWGPARLVKEPLRWVLQQQSTHSKTTQQHWGKTCLICWYCATFICNQLTLINDIYQ